MSSIMLTLVVVVVEHYLAVELNVLQKAVVSMAKLFVICQVIISDNYTAAALPNYVVTILDLKQNKKPSKQVMF